MKFLDFLVYVKFHDVPHTRFITYMGTREITQALAFNTNSKTTNVGL